ncbi:MAG: hypothetical protein JWN24_3212 [Phycisphaerales bacterium]|nr:hypothetical protein [Phycisphaerales bacterium]
MQRRRKTTTSVLNRNSNLKARSPRANAVRLASNSACELLEQRQLLSNSFGANFEGGGNGQPPLSLGATDFAGVPAVAQNNWNNIPGGTGAGVPLLDNASNFAATLNFTSGGTYATVPNTITPQPGDQTLNTGYIFGNSDIKISGIPYAAYDVYIYEIVDGGPGRVETTTNVNTGQSFFGASATANDINHVSGTPNTYQYTQTTSTNFAAPTVDGDYVKFSLQSGANFEFTTAAPGNGYLEGFQVVENTSGALGTPVVTFSGAPFNTASGVTINWAATNATTYDLIRADDAGFTTNVTSLATATAATTFTDNAVNGGTNGKPYFYKVVAHAAAQTDTSASASTFVFGTITGLGWSAAFYHNQGGGSSNANALDPLGDSLAGNTTAPFQTKIDPTIDFSGGQNLAMDGFNSFNQGANQSIRFDGYIQAPSSGTMTFWSGSDDGIQVSINEGTDASPNWVTVTQKLTTGRGVGGLGGGPYNEAVEVDTTSAALSNGSIDTGAPFQFVAGHLYHVEVAIQNGGGGWGGHLGWSGPAAGTPGANSGTIIPQGLVYLPTPSTPSDVLTTPDELGGVQVTWAAGFGVDSVGIQGGVPTGYLVESSTNGGASWASVGTVNAVTHANPVGYSLVDAAGTATTLYRVTATNPAGSSAPELAGSVNATVAGTGDGWSAAFFHDQGGGSGNGKTQTPYTIPIDPLGDALNGNPNAVVNSKIDTKIDFSGNQNATMDGFPGFNNGANQSIRFDGYIKAPASGTMTFWTGSDDGIQASINEGTDANPNWVTVTQRMQDGRGQGAPFNEHHEVDTVSAPVANDTFTSGPAFNFVAGHLYHIEVAVQNGGGGWGGHLGWSGPAAGLAGAATGTIIPQSAVYAIAPAEPSSLVTVPGGGVIAVKFSDGAQGEVVGINGAATGFKIFRSVDGGAFTLLTTIAANANSNPQTYTYGDTAVSLGHNYKYSIAATTAYATSSLLSTSAAVSPSPILGTPGQLVAVRQADPTKVVVTWGAITGAASYDVKRATSIDASGNLVSPTDLGNQPSNTFTDTGLSATTDYYYTVQAMTTTAGIFPSAVSNVVFVGHGDGWYAAWYAFQNNANPHSVDDPNAKLAFQRVETGPIHYGANDFTNGDNVGPANYPPQWVTAHGTTNGGLGDNMGARWVSYLEAPVTGYYTFGAASDDGNNVVVYDASGAPVLLTGNDLTFNRGVPGTPDPGPVVDHTGTAYKFTAGHKYLVQYEFNNGGGGWGTNLYWSASSTVGGPTDLMNQQFIPADDAVVPTPAFVTLDANNPAAPGLTKDQSFYTLNGAPNDTAIFISWNNIGADSYNVYILDNTTNPGGTPTKLTGIPITASNGAPINYTATGLTNGDSYTLYVTGISQSGETTIANAAQVTITPSSQPPLTAPTVTIAQDLGAGATADNPATLGNTDTDRVVVSWNAIPFATGYIVTPYEDGVAQTPITLGNVTSYLPSIAINHSWTFTVQAFNTSPTDTGNGPGKGPISAQSNTDNLSQGVIEGYYADQFWHSGGGDISAISKVGTPDNLTVMPDVFFNNGDQNTANPGASLADRVANSRGRGAAIGSAYSTVFEGSITAPTTGSYVFGFHSDDSSALLINGVLVAAENGCCDDYPFQTGQTKVTLNFNQGDKISFIYFMEQGGGGHETNIIWSINGAAQVTVPASQLSVIDQGVGVNPNGTPGAATGLTATQHTPGSGTIDVAFTDNAVNELHYTLLRSTNAAMTGAITVATTGYLSSTGTQTLQDTSGTDVSGTTYYYEVVASNLYGSTASAVVPITGTFVNTPSNFFANPGNNLETVLRWTNALVSTGTSVIIESSPDGVTWTTVTTQPVSGAGLTQVYRISGGTAGTETFYRIHSTDGTLNSDLSAVEGVIPVALPGPTPSVVDYSAGFNPNTLVVNSAGNDVGVPSVLAGGQLQLTSNIGNQVRTAWQTAKVAVGSFTTTFDYTANAGPNLADGFAFVLQNDPTGSAALGGGGGGKGITNLVNMIGLGLNPYNAVSQGVLFLNGVQIATQDLTVDPTTMAATGINLHSGDTFEVVITYDGTNLSAKITDVTSTTLPAPSTTISAAAIQTAVDTALGVATTTPVNIPSIVGAPIAYAGFGGATGGVQETQTISNWTYGTSIAPPPAVAAFTVPNSVEGTAFATTTVNYTGTAGDTFTATVNYGDGSTPSTFAVSGGTFTIGHAYAEDGTFTVSVSVTDTTANVTSSPATTSTATVTGAVLGATIAGAPAGPITAGTAVNLNFNVTQPNSLEADAGTPSWTITGPAGFTTLTGTSPTTSFTPSIAGTYHVTMTASEAGAADLETGTATAVDIVVTNGAAPTYLGTQIDDGNRQRSVIRNLTFKFSSAVNAPTAGSITLARSNAAGSNSGTNNGAADTDVSAALDFANETTTDGGKTWTIPFKKSIAGATDASGSLTDGIYKSTVHASLITNAAAQTLQGGDQVKVFHRTFGDVVPTVNAGTGGFKLTNAEFTRFSNAYLSNPGQTNYNRYFDFAGPNATFPNGRQISNADFTQFSNRFNLPGFIYTPSGL